MSKINELAQIRETITTTTTALNGRMLTRRSSRNNQSEFKPNPIQNEGAVRLFGERMSWTPS